MTIGQADVPLAERMREDYLQAEAARQPIVVKKQTPKFTGNLDADFAGGMIVKFQKLDTAHVRSVAAWDEKNLYSGLGSPRSDSLGQWCQRAGDDVSWWRHRRLSNWQPTRRPIPSGASPCWAICGCRLAPFKANRKR